MKYGLEILTSYERHNLQPRDGISEISRSHTGNAVLRIGRELEQGGRHEIIGHVVLTRAETLALIDDLARIAHTRTPHDEQPDPEASTAAAIESAQFMPDPVRVAAQDDPRGERDR